MAFDGITLKSVIFELNSCIIGGKVNKIFQPNKNEIIIEIYSNGKNYSLDVCISSNLYRMNLTSHSKPNPYVAPNFCMLLRKHLTGFKIKEIISYDLERIGIIKLEGYNELNDLVEKNLVIELMGKHSNIILANQNMQIIDSIRHLDITSGSSRDIMPGRIYSFPKNEKQSFIILKRFEEFEKIIKNAEHTSIEKNIYTNFIGISKEFLDNIPFEFTFKELPSIYSYIKTLLDNMQNTVCKKTEKGYSIIFDEKDNTISINNFLDNFYFEKESSDNFLSYRNNVLKHILTTLNKYKKRLENINLKLKECNNMDTYKLYGELLTSNLYKIKYLPNQDSITLENYYDNLNEITIPLDNTISLSANAKKYFKKYNKLKNTLDIVQKQRKITKLEIDYIESIIYSLEECKTIADIDEIYEEVCEYLNLGKKIKNTVTTSKKKQNFTSKPKKFEIDGYEVFVGKSNKQNDYLSLKLANKYDMWFHTKDIHGSHVVLRTNNSTPSMSTIIKCASLAAYYSKAKESSNVPVDYTLIKNVKKPSGSKPGMVIYTDYETINVNPKKY